MKLVVSILLLLTGCAVNISNVPLAIHDDIPISFVTKHGITIKNISGQPLNQDRIEKAIDLLNKRLAAQFPYTYDPVIVQATYYASSPVIIFEKDDIPCAQGIYGYCEGLTELDKGVIHVKWHECIGETSLIHELLHVLQYYIEGTSDADHNRSDFFINTKNGNRRNSSSIESYVTWELKFFGCGK